MHALHNMTSRQLRCGDVHGCVLAYPDNKQQQAPCRAHTSQVAGGAKAALSTCSDAFSASSCCS